MREEIAAGLAASKRIPLPVVCKPVLTTPGRRSAPLCLEADRDARPAPA